jgi:periplasmic protein CpxP/Spy
LAGLELKYILSHQCFDGAFYFKEHRGFVSWIFKKSIGNQATLVRANRLTRRRLKMKVDLKTTNSIVAIAGVLSLIVAAIAFSQGPGGHPPGPGGPFGGGPRDGFIPFARDLNLTDDQKAQIKKLTDASRESTKALHDQLKALHESAPDPLKDGVFNEDAVRSAAQARSSIQVELEVARAKLFSQIYTVLTADQRATLAAKRQQFEQRRPD